MKGKLIVNVKAKLKENDVDNNDATVSVGCNIGSFHLGVLSVDSSVLGIFRSITL